MRGFYPEDFLIPFAAATSAARSMDRGPARAPVATNHSREVDCDIEIACTRRRILGLRGHVYGDMGAYIRTNGGVVLRRRRAVPARPYAIRDVAITVEALMTSKTPVGTIRAPGRFEANFFRERLIDMVARDLGLDPMDFRRENLIRGRAAVRDRQARALRGRDRPRHRRLSRDLRARAERDRLGGEEVAPGRLIDGRYHALLPFRSWRAAARARKNARVASRARRLGDRARGLVGAGEGAPWRRVAADTLKLPFERVRILHGSTTYLREGFGTFASRSMVVGGSAVMDGCNNLIAAIRAAAERFGLPNEEITVAGGEVRAGEKRASLADFAGLEAEGAFRPRSAPTATAPTPATAVDARTGRVEILDYVAIEDGGARQSAHRARPGHRRPGAGAGRRVSRPVLYDGDAQILNTSLADYLVPLACDFPNVRAITMELRRSRPIRSAPRCGRGRWWRRRPPMRWRRRSLLGVEVRELCAAVARASVAAGQRRAREAGEFSG